MEIKMNTNQILKILQVVAWIIFIGICIEAGAFIFNAVFMMLLSPANAKHVWQQADLSNLFQYDKGFFLSVSLLISIVAVLKSCLFYLIVKILHEKKLNMHQPFNMDLGRFLIKAAYLSFGIGLFCYWGVNYTAWFVKKGVKMPAIQDMDLGGADVWLFMGVILFVISQIFKRGIEIQSENDLTV